MQNLILLLPHFYVRYVIFLPMRMHEKLINSLISWFIAVKMWHFCPYVQSTLILTLVTQLTTSLYRSHFGEIAGCYNLDLQWLPLLMSVCVCMHRTLQLKTSSTPCCSVCATSNSRQLRRADPDFLSFIEGVVDSGRSAVERLSQDIAAEQDPEGDPKEFLSRSAWSCSTASVMTSTTA